MKKIKLLSYPINEKTPTYGNRNPFLSNKLSSINNGDTANSSKWVFQTNHIGTHIDFPKHFCINGKTLSDYEPDYWIFNHIGFIECDVSNFELEIQKIPEDIEILVWKSGFGKFRNKTDYWKNQPVIPSFFADLIKSKFPKIRVFGFDMISLTSKLDRQEGKKIHKKFLCDYEVLIVEDMNLNDILNLTLKQIIISPLNVEYSDGSPCTIYGLY